MALIFDQRYSKIDEGSWGEFEGSKFLIVHSGNIRFQRTLARLQAPHRQKIERGRMDPAELKNILCRAMAEALILDWRNVLDKKGNEAPFSKENVEIALKQNDLFREFVMDFSNDMNNFREDEEADLGNAS